MRKKCNKCLQTKPADYFQENTELCIRCVYHSSPHPSEDLVTYDGPARQCRLCKEWRHLTTFHKNGIHTRYDCNKCAAKRRSKRYWKDPNQTRAKARAAYKIDDSYSRRSYVKRRFGITLEEYNDWFKRSAYACEVCGIKPKERRHLHLDHCHATGTIRGVLCHSCNHALGFVKDQPTTLVRLHAYLKRIRSPKPTQPLLSLILSATFPLVVAVGVPL